MRGSSSPEVLTSAEEVVDYIVDTYSEANLAAEQIRSRAAHREDPVRDFSTICRREIESLWKAL
jgi:hypothetical protein